MIIINDKAIQTQSSYPVTMYYDSACLLCTNEAHKLQRYRPQDIHLVPVDLGLEALKQGGFSREQALTYICVQDGQHNWYTGMDAIRLLHKVAQTRWARFLSLPGIKQLGDYSYPLIAHNRYRFPNWLLSLFYGKAAVQACQSGACRVPSLPISSKPSSSRSRSSKPGSNQLSSNQSGAS
ncbi:thiol-disulfide oxidoreductase DCC family protein [Psychrobacter lutiphocae]|uniref:thiol-disulfide oxidoreductase DCC family protein n=1 Tax=Psychrobacter lutiphocae TaxID=540500 RepID=UPI0003818956|nr:DUF393 domain-containing protein [Psychrobacter lutiphocae]